MVAWGKARPCEGRGIRLVDGGERLMPVGPRLESSFMRDSDLDRHALATRNARVLLARGEDPREAQRLIPEADGKSLPTEGTTMKAA